MALDTASRGLMISSLRTKLLLAVGVLAIGAIAAVAFSARQTTRNEFERFRVLERTRESDDARETLDRAAAALNNQCCGPEAMSAVTQLLGPRQVLLAFDDKGTLVSSAGPALERYRITGTLELELLTVRVTSREPGAASTMVLSLRGGPSALVGRAGGGSARVFLVSLPESAEDNPAVRFLGTVDRRLLAITALVAALALAITALVAGRIVRPIAELGRAAEDLAGGHLARRVTVRGHDEVAALARSFNAMAAELERQERLRQDMVRDVAHELRTPLTALQCRFETVSDGMAQDPKVALRDVGESVAHLSRLVDDLEELTRADARELSLTIVDVNLAAACRSAVAASGLERDSRVRFDLDEAATARGDAVRVRQILVNLLSNAARHTPAEGAITIRAVVRDDSAVLEVHNTGSRLTSSECERVFDRFYRADPARQRATGGSGLGLAIVKQLAEAQGGRARAESDDTGVTFSVTFVSATAAAYF